MPCLKNRFSSRGAKHGLASINAKPRNRDSPNRSPPPEMTRECFITAGSQAQPRETAVLLAIILIKPTPIVSHRPKGSQDVPRNPAYPSPTPGASVNGPASVAFATQTQASSNVTFQLNPGTDINGVGSGAPRKFNRAYAASFFRLYS